jgi:mRNA interferase YafQ
MLIADYTGQFKKDYKLAMKRGFDIFLIDNLIRDLINEKPLQAKHKDHALSGDYTGYREWRYCF